jgi:hypothetical protein
MNIAQSSLEELRYYFILGSDLGDVKTEDERASAEEIAKMLAAYMGALGTES